MKITAPFNRAFFSAVRRAFSAAFPAANNTGTRTSVAGFPRDPRRELTPMQRMEIVKKSRLLRNALGYVSRLIEGTVRYSIGSGLVPSASTTDPAFNERADRSFEEWAQEKLVDVTGENNFYGLQKLAASEMMADGEVFAVKCKLEGYCQLQLLKTHQVGDLPWSIQRDAFRDGLRLNEFGRVLGYRVLQDGPRGIGSYGMTRLDYNAEDIIHIFDPERIGQRRGLPWMYHGVNCCIDILDLNALEKVAAKLHSYFAAAITTPEGEKPKGLTGNLPAAKKANNADNDKLTRQYHDFLGGGAMPVLKDGEKIDFFASNRPSTTFAGFIDYLKSDVCAGWGVQNGFWEAVSGMNGQALRFVLVDASWLFEDVQQLVVDRFCDPVRKWVIANAIMKGELALGRDPQWWACEWQGPQKITVDRSRDGNLEISLVNNGMMTLDEFWKSRGYNPRKMRRKRIDELAEDMEYAKLKGVPFGLYMRSDPGQPGVTTPLLTQAVDSTA